MNQRDLVELHNRFLEEGWQIKSDKNATGYAYLLEKDSAFINIMPSDIGFSVRSIDSNGKSQKLEELAENVAWLEVEKFIESENKNIQTSRSNATLAPRSLYMDI